MMPKILNCPECGEKYMAENVGNPCPVCEAKKEGERAVAYPVPCPMGCQDKEFPGGYPCPVCKGNGYIFGIRNLSD